MRPRASGVPARTVNGDGDLSLPVRRQLTLAIYALLFGEAASIGRARMYVKASSRASAAAAAERDQARYAATRAAAGSGAVEQGRTPTRRTKHSKQAHTQRTSAA